MTAGAAASHNHRRLAAPLARERRPAPLREPTRSASSTAALTLGAIGVVYGDIGTSPLYALKQVFANGHVPLTPDNVFGVLSLVFWTLTVVVSIKYVVLILRADNNGEGGLIAMLALASQAVRDRPPLRRRLLFVGIFGTAIFFGDGVITPAISVLGAVEGLQVAAPGAAHLGRADHAGRAGRALHVPAPRHRARRQAVRAGDGGLVRRHRHPRPDAHRRQPGDPEGADRRTTRCCSCSRIRRSRFIALGSVVLCVTGAEALYADMGHFGKRPIRLAWFGMAMPALLLNYFGQGAMLLADPSKVGNPFFQMAPPWALYPLIALATCAAVIASQALITAAFSVTKQAIQLGYLPRLRIQHTSVKETGQIYVPFVNWGLFVGIVIAVVLFGSSDSARRRLRHHGDDRHADHDDDDLLRRPLRLEVRLVAGRRWRPASSSSSTSPSSPPTSSR